MKTENEMTNEEWLQSQCNRYVNGQCNTLVCLNRGGYKKGVLPPNWDKATCHAHEILERLKSHKA